MDQTAPRILSTSRNRQEKHQGRRLILAGFITLCLHAGLWTALDHYLGLNRYSISEIPPMKVRIQYMSPAVNDTDPAAPPVNPTKKDATSAEEIPVDEALRSQKAVVTEDAQQEEAGNIPVPADTAADEEDTEAVEKPTRDTSTNSMKYTTSDTKDFPSKDFSVLSSGMHLPRPDYPPAARRWGYEGTVRARIVISAHGKVEKVIIEESSGYPILDDAVIRTITDLWEFNPPGGEISILKEFEFTLN